MTSTKKCKYGINNTTKKCNAKGKTVKRECKYGRNETTGKCNPKKIEILINQKI
jgi:hypothetical protein